MGAVDQGRPLPSGSPPAPLPGAASTERPASSSSSGSGTRCEGAARSMRLAVAGWRAAERTKTRGAAPWLVRGAGTARLHVPAEPPQPKLGPAARFNYPAREEGGGRARRRRGRGVPGPHSSQAASPPWISGATPSRPRPGGGLRPTARGGSEDPKLLPGGAKERGVHSRDALPPLLTPHPYASETRSPPHPPARGTR